MALSALPSEVPKMRTVSISLILAPDQIFGIAITINDFDHGAAYHLVSLKIAPASEG